MKTKPFLQVCLFLIFGGACSVILKQDDSFDFRNYHFYVPYAFLNNRYDYDVAPAQLQTYINPTMDVLYYKLVMGLQNSIAVSFVMGLWYGLFAWATFRLVAALQNDNFLSGFIATLLAITGVSAVSQIGLTSNEVAIAAMLMCSILLTFSAIIYPCFLPNTINATRQLWLAGLLAGMAVGFKLTAAGFVLALWISMTIVLLSRRDSHAMRYLLYFGVFSLIGFCITGAHWHLFLWSHYQNPFFPMFNSFFKSPYFDFQELYLSGYRVLTIEKMIKLPFLMAAKNSNLVGERWFSDPRLLVGYISIFAILATMIKNKIYSEEKNEELLFFTYIWIISYIVWAYLHGIYRYAVTLEPLSIILIIILLKQFKFKRWVLNIVFSLMIVVIFKLTLYNGWDRLYNHSGKTLVIKPPLMPADSLVIMASDEPLSYLIPFFDSFVRFVSVKNNFLSIDKSNLLQKKESELIRGWKGSIFIMFPNGYDLANDSTLEYFDLSVGGSSTKACRVISSNIDLSPPYICELTHNKN